MKNTDNETKNAEAKLERANLACALGLGAATITAISTSCTPLGKYDMVVVDGEGAFNYFTSGMKDSRKDALLKEHGFIREENADAFYKAQMDAQARFSQGMRKIDQNYAKDKIKSVSDKVNDLNKELTGQTKQISGLEVQLIQKQVENAIANTKVSALENQVQYAPGTDYTIPSVILGVTALLIAGGFAFRDKILKYVPFMNK